MTKFVLLLLLLSGITVFAGNDEQYLKVTPQEMEMPKSQDADAQTINQIENDMGVPPELFPENGIDLPELNSAPKSSGIKSVFPVYNPQLQSRYAITEDCRLLKLSRNSSEWITLCGNFSKKGYESDSFIVSPDENFVLFIMIPLTKKGFLLRLFNVSENKLNDIGTFDSPVFCYFSDDSKDLIIINQFTSKVHRHSLAAK
jgi:hypothetical protein